jgi:hypothetical protein
MFRITLPSAETPGKSEFVEALERSTSRPLIPRQPGRPKKPLRNSKQDRFGFAA